MTTVPGLRLSGADYRSSLRCRNETLEQAPQAGPQALLPFQLCCVETQRLRRTLSCSLSLMSYSGRYCSHWLLQLRGDELLAAVDIIGCAREGGVGHDMYGERGHF